jgi:methylisocitrate lyase
MQSKGLIFRQLIQEALKTKKPLQIVGAVNAYCGMLAKKTGFQMLYLSGSGVATASHGLPDLGITDLHDVVEDAKRIIQATDAPLLVDIDTGLGATGLNIARTIRELEAVGVAGVHLEDQVAAKRCGHRPGKAIVPTSEMVDRIKAAVAARRDPNFVIMARTDALANEGLEAAIARARAYIAAGADMLFPEALNDLKQYTEFAAQLPNVPLLANITEFGKTPLFTAQELGAAGVAMVLYPLSAFRAMSKAALNVYSHILKDGTQANVLDTMQTRQELYDYLEYHKYEQEMDQLFGPAKEEDK